MILRDHALRINDLKSLDSEQTHFSSCNGIMQQEESSVDVNF